MSNPYNLFLDDERSPHQVTWVSLPLVSWTIVKNYQEFVDTITKIGLPIRVSFDHDLAKEHYPYGIILPDSVIPYDKYREKTGMECVKWLVEYCRKHDCAFPEYYLHTMNPIGKSNMQSYIISYNKYYLTT